MKRLESNRLPYGRSCTALKWYLIQKRHLDFLPLVVDGESCNAATVALVFSRPLLVGVGRAGEQVQRNRGQLSHLRPKPLLISRAQHE